MSTQDLKLEIQKKLEHVPDAILKSILDYLKEAESQSMDKTMMAINLNRILKEDKQLLERLAQ